jgi:hypothetical protein
MSKITNVAKDVSGNPVVAANRAQIEHRATWMGLIYDEMKKAGIDAEPIVRKAIKRCGLMHGQNLFRAKCADPSDCKDFEKVFVTDMAIETFQWDSISADHDNLGVHFHYCPLLSAWQKLGFDDETCALLCDMAMDGDRGIAEAMELKIDIGDTIAKGCPDCKIHFHK